MKHHDPIMQTRPEAAQRLKDKVAIVTGGGGTNSIGRSIAIRFAEEGARVAVTGRNAVRVSAVADEITSAGGRATGIECDVRDLARCEAMADQVADTWGRIDILVNNAASFRGDITSVGQKPFNEWTPEEWDDMMRVNLRGQWFCARAVFPYMKERRYGKIINIGSASLFEGTPGFPHYLASKGAVLGLTRGLGKELGEYGIRVNTLAPGLILTEATLDLIKGKVEAADHVLSQRAIKERHLVADDLAGPAVFLASEDSDMIACQTLVVDGGLVMW
ncbi:MAG: 3-oxoacyl-ACP reductase FabG [Thermoleophilia bacterium]|nr:3-oxoacyl-ACP reductase FabG [Thermoleophilia bacterium]